MKIAVLGGGNGSLAAAGDLALAGHEVRLWRRDRAAIEAHKRGGRADHGQGFPRPARGAAGADHRRHRRGRARRRAHSVSGSGHGTARHCTRARTASGRRAGGVPAARHVRLGAVCQDGLGCRQPRKRCFAETGTLPWLTRKHGPFEAAITIRAKRLPTGVFPLTMQAHALEVIGRAFPGVSSRAAMRYPAR